MRKPALVVLVERARNGDVMDNSGRGENSKVAAGSNEVKGEGSGRSRDDAAVALKRKDWREKRKQQREKRKEEGEVTAATAATAASKGYPNMWLPQLLHIRTVPHLLRDMAARGVAIISKPTSVVPLREARKGVIASDGACCESTESSGSEGGRPSEDHRVRVASRKKTGGKKLKKPRKNEREDGAVAAHQIPEAASMRVPQLRKELTGRAIAFGRSMRKPALVVLVERARNEDVTVHCGCGENNKVVAGSNEVKGEGSGCSQDDAAMAPKEKDWKKRRKQRREKRKEEGEVTAATEAMAAYPDMWLSQLQHILTVPQLLRDMAARGEAFMRELTSAPKKKDWRAKRMQRREKVLLKLTVPQLLHELTTRGVQYNVKTWRKRRKPRETKGVNEALAVAPVTSTTEGRADILTDHGIVSGNKKDRKPRVSVTEAIEGVLETKMSVMEMHQELKALGYTYNVRTGKPGLLRLLKRARRGEAMEVTNVASLPSLKELHQELKALGYANKYNVRKGKPGLLRLLEHARRGETMEVTNVASPQPREPTSEPKLRKETRFGQEPVGDLKKQWKRARLKVQRETAKERAKEKKTEEKVNPKPYKTLQNPTKH
jgi:antitoxin (DNA-binding transcriptional repressor) of toxin-antitoxin stability system